MIYFSYTENTICPTCQHEIESHMAGMSTGLGPPLVECPNCRGSCLSGRREWPTFGMLSRCWFFILTLVYLTVLGFEALLFSYMGFAFAGIDTKGWYPLAIPVAWCLAIIVVQVYRVGASIRRHPTSSNTPVPLTFWNLQINLQLKFLGGVLLSVIAVILCSWMLHILFQ